ncbi:MAG: cytochrome c [Acidimicrobiaceae bacterium]|nr:cytochrome c [Acidimicrobiaceae bacterium]
MTGRLGIATVTLAASLLAFACGADTSNATDSPTPAPAPAPATSTAPPSPTSTATALAVPDGAAVYQQYCAECHGVDLRGTDKGPSQLSIIYEPNHHGDYAYRVAIREGTREHHWWFGDMPPVEDITDLEIEKVISFIRAEQQRLGFEQ